MILDSQDDMHNELYAKKRGFDKRSCSEARKILEEALVITRTLNSQTEELELAIQPRAQEMDVTVEANSDCAHPLNRAN